MNKDITRLGIVAALFMLAMAPPGCGGSSETSNASGDNGAVEGSPCVQGASETCTCDDGRTGAQSCESGAWSACVCTDAAGCGNGKVDLGEDCEGSDLGGQTCASVTMNAMPDGALSCTTSCKFDTSSCSGSTTGTGGLLGGP